MPTSSRPKLAVWKFASCDGCQLSLLDCEDELLALAAAVEIANFPEASRAVVRGPYDISLVEGSITTPHDAERIHQIRRTSKLLVTIGACATAGGIQALRNFADVREWVPLVYASPAVDRDAARRRRRSPITCRWTSSSTAARSTRSSWSSTLLRLPPRPARRCSPAHSVCIDCKRRGTVCVAVADGPALPRPGDPHRLRRHLPVVPARLLRLLRSAQGSERRGPGRAISRPGARSDADIVRLLRSYNAGAEAFRKASESHERHSS